MPEALTDAELRETLRLLEEHDHNAAATAAALGVSPTTIRQRRALIKARGITLTGAKPSSNDEVARLRTKLAVAEKELREIVRDRVTAQEIREQLYGLANLTPEPPKWLFEKRVPGSPGVPMTLWSDWHYGEVVDPDQMGGQNAFNRAIAKDRIKRLATIVCDLAISHMVKPKYPGIVVCLGGDMISGAIHEELRETNDGPLQKSLLEVQEQLIAALEVMGDQFGRVFVPCVVGNHARTTIKPRAKGRAFESYEWNLYHQLARHFQSRDKQFVFSVPDEADVPFSVMGHRFLLTHGDALGVKGGDGIIGSIGPIARGTFKVGRAEARVNRDFDTLLMGHWHTYMPRSEAVPAIVNGALKGYDEFAHTILRVPYARPSQALWFVHPDYGVTAQWQMFVDGKKAGSKRAWCEFPSGK